MTLSTSTALASQQFHSSSGRLTVWNLSHTGQGEAALWRDGAAEGVLVLCELTPGPAVAVCLARLPRGHLCSRFPGRLWRLMELLPASPTVAEEPASLTGLGNLPQPPYQLVCKMLLLCYSDHFISVFICDTHVPPCMPFKKILLNPASFKLNGFFFNILSNGKYLKLLSAHQLSL